MKFTLAMSLVTVLTVLLSFSMIIRPFRVGVRATSAVTVLSPTVAGRIVVVAVMSAPRRKLTVRTGDFDSSESIRSLSFLSIHAVTFTAVETVDEVATSRRT